MIGLYIDTSTSFPVYTYGEMMLLLSNYYVEWEPSNKSDGTFSIDGSSYSFSNYSGVFRFPGGIITSGAFQGISLSYLGTNAYRLEFRAFKSTGISDVSLEFCTYIGGEALQNNNFSSVDLPVCSYIEHSAFYGCSLMTQVSLPLCEYVGDSAFYDCSQLQSINLPSCKYIGSYAFDGCRKLSQVSVPVCENIGYAAFFDCVRLTTVSLPACSYVGSAAFYGCNNLTSVYIPNVVSYTQSMFRDCYFSEFYSPTCLSVGLECFRYCYRLKTVELPACRYVDMLAFGGCSHLTTVSLQNCSFINTNAFYNCSSLNTITLGGSSVCRLSSSYAFYGAGITSSKGFIYVPSSLVSAYKSASNWSFFSSRIYPINN